ncbi:tripartite tricarboxylate transporter permease [Mesorhizobium sp. B2-6-1]|uniref:tripartite tricarboxylate transporter permease n=1 Tax=Mesorhizobium sp. B2-6-1 TaxID=2589916 RepID=UPI001126FA8E|nr:tripartite tricarboxylate transporter permease [Mesorhizobium sp. B2-6-1]TPJ57630.1 tripartite tricarboxylate transporter permease [Mesorhizobium sp. B2-6-1]
MEIISGIILGFSVALTPENLLYCFIGAVLGTAIGVLPGIGATATIALLLPITFTLGPLPAIIMLSGIYYGSQYGGSTTAILVKIPGEGSSVVTAIDGHEMARQGKAGVALTAAALGSLFAGTVATLVIGVFAVPLSYVALRFGAPEYFSLVVLGLVVSAMLAHGSFAKGLAMIVAGAMLSMVGTDLYTGAHRLTFGFNGLADGISFVVISVGLFGIGEIIRNLETSDHQTVASAKIERLWPTGAELRQMAPPILRGTAVGSFLGILPGAGATLSSFVSYSLEKKFSKGAVNVGEGAVEGVAGPESANNAAAQTSFIPMLTLGLPANPVMALMIGALVIQGIRPGPGVITNNPELFWGLIASMWIGNVILLVLNLPLIGIWVRLLSVPYKYLYPAIVAFCIVGVYAVSLSIVEVWLIAAFGAAGYFLMRLDFEPAPLLMGFVLGPLLEEQFRRALIIARGDAMVFLERPISAVLLGTAVLTIVLTALPALRKRRGSVFQESESL